MEIIRAFSFFSERWYSESDHPSWRPRADIFESGNQLIIRIEIAGMKADDFSITAVDGAKLVIAGVRPDPACKSGFHLMEIPFGDFELTFNVPPGFVVDESRIRADYENGFLSVYCPRRRPSYRKITSTPGETSQ
ncbi:MAG: Hsp20/alpha crystallin family protein [Deltaproteobacteria bacterium]|nr:Hsp20/alpha crystallin family protein [Deltaproteobacteria bacterium]